MYIKATDSTNTLMKELLAKGEWPEGERFLYTAFQTAGRGQAGNGWESEEGKNLLCSILLPPRKELFDLNVLTAVAVQRLLGEGFTIKWPNDIYYGDKKIAGILIENAILGSEVAYSIAGIGLNVNQTTFLSSAPNPVSLKQISGKETDIDALMQALMTQIEALEAMDEAQVWVYYREHLYRREGFWPFVEREVSTAPTMNADRKAEGVFLAKIENVRTNGEIELRDQNGNLRIYHFKQVRYVI
jgi:BirA family biotin operon repressor/biotin-[acetyl-CoA-carboxylase] ligase